MYYVHVRFKNHISPSIPPSFAFSPGCHVVCNDAAFSGAVPSANLSSHRRGCCAWASGEPDPPSSFAPFTATNGILSCRDCVSEDVCVTGKGIAALCESLQIHTVSSPVALATQCDTKMNRNVVKTKLIGLQRVPGRTSNIPFVSPANQK